MHKNQKGFSILEVLLLLVVATLLGLVGWKVLDARSSKAAKNASTRGTSPVEAEQGKEAKTPSVPSTKHTVTYETASYTIDVPNTWLFKELGLSEDLSSYSVYINDPAKRLDLVVNIVLEDSSIEVPATSYASFVGPDKITTYLHGIKGVRSGNAYESIMGSRCKDKYCYFVIDSKHWLDFYFRSYDGHTPVNFDDPLIKDIETIISSVRF
jgi:hypothetical protein